MSLNHSLTPTTIVSPPVFYGFDIHKGYGTKAHYAALTEQGPSEIHRMTFLKKFYGEK